MRGPVGSSIEITIRRKGLKKAKIFTIIREIIEIKSVISELKNNEVGYLRLRAFNENSSNQLKEEIFLLMLLSIVLCIFFCCDIDCDFVNIASFSSSRRTWIFLSITFFLPANSD